ncbi:hypothetical protein HK097_005685 [Rhizophlyctis rosea]|uniref:Uncharacterized protein n=1 Tax=Rhizophlyctis rosea TaxID=64517 RepID=A0AAD5WW52_9FUNG|nr:hypothetical protein HK097_005685 [Rhizophlyctis rosea]
MFVSMLGFARCLVFCCAPRDDEEEEMEEGKILGGVDLNGKGGYGKVLESEKEMRAEEEEEGLPVYEKGYVAVSGDEEK